MHHHFRSRSYRRARYHPARRVSREHDIERVDRRLRPGLEVWSWCRGHAAPATVVRVAAYVALVAFRSGTVRFVPRFESAAWAWDRRLTSRPARSA